MSNKQNHDPAAAAADELLHPEDTLLAQEEQLEMEGLGTENEAEDGENEAPAPGLAAQLADAQAKAAALQDKYLRLVAEFDNHRKRSGKQMADIIGSAAQDILTALLPVLDDFDRMQKNDPQAFTEGVALVHTKLHNILKSKGLQGMESDAQPFDPELHEAVVEIPAPDESMKGKIVDTIDKGYTLNGKIIRHAKVVVGK